MSDKEVDEQVDFDVISHNSIESVILESPEEKEDKNITHIIKIRGMFTGFVVA